MKTYRKNVAAIIFNKQKKILVAERAYKKNAWQFPQGGVDKGEKKSKAIMREVHEELGIKPKHLHVVSHKGGYKYNFEIKHQKFFMFRGQKQTYYLMKFNGEDSEISLNHEFQNYKWIYPEFFSLKWVPKFKREVYCQVFMDFFYIDLKINSKLENKK